MANTDAGDRPAVLFVALVPGVNYLEESVKQSKVPTAQADHGVDGGAAALSGFLYQMLGCAAVTAAAWQEPRGTGSVYDALITLARDREAYQEMHGQDLVLQPLLDATVRGTVLVQFKYSRDGTGKSIAQEELKAIAGQLAKAVKRVQAGDGQVAACYLVTNRQLGPRVRTAALPKAVRDMIGELQVVAERAMSNWHQTLRNFAARYGALPGEIDDGIEKIVARLVQQGAGLSSGPPLRCADFVEAFTGSRDARPLVRTGLEEQMKEELRPLEPRKGGKLVRREILGRVFQETPDRALIVFTGRGGMGKTATLHAWAEELSAVSHGPVCPLVAASTTYDLGDDWPGSLLVKWRGVQAPGSDKIEFNHIVERLKIANPGLESPVLHLCLDGVDEDGNDPSRNQLVGRVLRWFLGQDHRNRQQRVRPAVRLVVTCRDEEQFAQYWLHNSSGFQGDDEEPPPMFRFERFTDPEFATVVQKNLPVTLHGRLLTRGPATPGLSMLTPFLEDGPVGTFDAAAKPAPDELINLLHDPAMWRAFLDLGESGRVSVVENDRKVRLEMAAGFVDRFCRKLEKRTRLRKNDVLSTLRHIAAAYQARAREYLKAAEWVSAACACGIFAISQASKLLEEARSGGLVDDNDKREWQWRNSLIEDYLLSPPDLT